MRGLTGLESPTIVLHKADSSFDGMQAYILSLGSVPRNPTLIAELEHFGIKPTVVIATDGRSWQYPFSPEVVNLQRFSAIERRLPTGPEIGCALSHLRCAKEADSSGTLYAMIFEEDASIIGDLRPAANLIKRLDPSRPSVVQLYSMSQRLFEKRSVTRLRTEPQVVAGRFLIPPYNTVAYMLNLAAIRILASKTIVEGTADWPPYAGNFDFWGLEPWPVSHSHEGSSIEPSRRELKKYRKNRGRYLSSVLDYLQLFRYRRVREESQSLGSIGKYIKRVVFRQSRLRWISIGKKIQRRW